MAAAGLLRSLPAPKHQPVVYDSTEALLGKEKPAAAPAAEVSAAGPARPIPPYGKRQGWFPRRPEDFGGGGAYPECHVMQYPMMMGKEGEDKSTKGVLPLSMDADGNIAFDAIVKQGENARKIVHSSHRALVPKVGEKQEELAKPDEEEVEATRQRTLAALQKVVEQKISAAQPAAVAPRPGEPTYIKYTPAQQGEAFNSGAKQRVIRMVEVAKDPLEPPKFKHKRVPKGSGSPPVPVMHSPPRAVTVKDQQDWKIPPCISNWKNPKGYTIPLDKRLAADGRGLQEVQINDNFAKLSEALYVAEQKAREAVEMRSKIQRELILKEKERKEVELRALAQRARMERAGGAMPAAAPIPASARSAGEARPAPAAARDDMDEEEDREERAERVKRERIREERRRERERERRLEAKEAAGGKRSKITRDRDRDISEKVALGQANVGKTGGEAMYDQRLFNQDEGIASGFGAEDNYTVYDKGLFAGSHPSVGGLYRPKKDADSEVYGGDDALEKVVNTDRFKPDREFAGTNKSAGPRAGPVEFEKDADEADPFGLDQFLTTVKKGKQGALDKIGGGGTMKAAAGGGPTSHDGYDGGSGRTRVDFQRGR
eukprot:jgi/Chlat1/8505/Chrsp80S07815